MLDKLQLTLADMQGRLFELSKKEGLNSEKFIKAFMLSDIAKNLDADFDHLQWAGEKYIMEKILDTLKDELCKGGEVYDSETLYWAGYVYRYWHFYTSETSKDIFKQAPPKTMQITYFPYHTMSVELAIEKLKESYTSTQKNN